jgi:hypothetical protein
MGLVRKTGFFTASLELTMATFPRLLLILLALVPLVSFAVCTNGHPSQQRESAEVVAIAIATPTREQALQEDRNDPQGITAHVYAANVVEVLSGKLPNAIPVRTENTSSRFPLTVGIRYLLFLHNGANGEYWVDSCGNSGPLSEKQLLADSLRAKGVPK